MSQSLWPFYYDMCKCKDAFYLHVLSAVGFSLSKKLLFELRPESGAFDGAGVAALLTLPFYCMRDNKPQWYLYEWMHTNRLILSAVEQVSRTASVLCHHGARSDSPLVINIAVISQTLSLFFFLWCSLMCTLLPFEWTTQTEEWCLWVSPLFCFLRAQT